MDNLVNTAATRDALLRRQEVERLTGLGRSAIYARMTKSHPSYDETFPRPVPIGGSNDKPTAVRWVASEVETWIHDRIAQRDNRHAA
jgi:prophage regulatory protein